VTGKPIAAARVLVRLSAIDPTTHDRRTLAEIRQRTSADGTYRFVMTPEQLAGPSLLVHLDVQHAGYVSRRSSVNGKAENLEHLPFFDDMTLERGKAIQARILTPEGNPATNVRISAYCTHSALSATYPKLGTFTEASTDADGRFRLNLFPSGPAVFWILSTDYALSTNILEADKRGDLGTIMLTRGGVTEGTVLDGKGKPVTGVYVQADREKPNGFREAGLLGIVDLISRSVVTDSDGKFTIHALPAGNYRVTAVEEPWDPAAHTRVLVRRPLPGVFADYEVTIDEGKTSGPIVIRALPHVVIEARIFDSKGNPCSGGRCSMHGRLDGRSWLWQGMLDASGRASIHAPLGLEMAQLDVRLVSRYAVRYRLTKNATFKNARPIDLGTLDRDIKEIEIICDDAPK
jgi:hypothetical protein